MKTFKRISLVFLALLLWTTFLAFGFSNGFLLRPITGEKSASAFVEATKEKLEEEYVGNLAMVVMEDGETAASFCHAKGEKVDENTLFPVASISKWVSAFGVMKLVEEGKIDLDAPVENYLTRWHLPPSDFDNQKVSVRNLLSHSSGLVDDLGYDGFKVGEKVQTLEESLTEAADSEYSEGIAYVGYEPGTAYMYSGAGYTLLQLLIEEVSQQSFQNYMQKEVFEPLQMKHSTFVMNEKLELHKAEVYKDDGSTRPMNTFTALAAASLFTSASDLAKFMKANVSSNPVLSEETLSEMHQPETFINSIPVYGLGPHLYSQNDVHSAVVGHDGSGNNAINTAARIDLISKNGIIILETGNHSFASEMADEWLFWQAGVADYVVMQRNLPFLLSLWVLGAVLIIVSMVLFFRKTGRRQKA